MSRFAAALSTCIFAMVLAIGAALMPSPAAAARVSKADEIALKQAIVACKAEAKGKKMAWLAGRKYVNNCVAEALKGRPNINVNQLLKDHPDMKEEKWDAI